MVSWSPRTVVLMSIIRLRNVRPAGTALAAKLRVPISDRRSCLEQSERLAHCSSAAWMSWSLSGGSRASRPTNPAVFRGIPSRSLVPQASPPEGEFPGRCIG